MALGANDDRRCEGDYNRGILVSYTHIYLAYLDFPTMLCMQDNGHHSGGEALLSLIPVLPKAGLYF